ncbi:MAG: hypothetical protein M1820_009520 [Bogoriella megaspora]|nr:MAG: hypothetical protein M1820_009520 [Bogoriella megaspora]
MAPSLLIQMPNEILRMILVYVQSPEYFSFPGAREFSLKPTEANSFGLKALATMRLVCQRIRQEATSLLFKEYYMDLRRRGGTYESPIFFTMDHANYIHILNVGACWATTNGPVRFSEKVNRLLDFFGLQLFNFLPKLSNLRSIFIEGVKWDTRFPFFAGRALGCAKLDDLKAMGLIFCNGHDYTEFLSGVLKGSKLRETGGATILNQIQRLRIQVLEDLGPRGRADSFFEVVRLASNLTSLSIHGVSNKDYMVLDMLDITHIHHLKVLYIMSICSSAELLAQLLRQNSRTLQQLTLRCIDLLSIGWDSVLETILAAHALYFFVCQGNTYEFSVKDAAMPEWYFRNMGRGETVVNFDVESLRARDTVMLGELQRKINCNRRRQRMNKWGRDDGFIRLKETPLHTWDSAQVAQVHLPTIT